MMLKPVKRRRLSMMIVDQMQQLILSGALLPGARCPSEKVLIQKFKTSRSSVLEALHILEVLGFIEIRRGATGGTFVCKPDFQNQGFDLRRAVNQERFTLENIYHTRLIVEPPIAKLAAQIATRKDIQMLRDCLAYHARTPKEENTTLGRNFDYLLATISGNHVLTTLIGSLFAAVQSLQRTQPLLPRAERISSQARIVDAIESRNADQAFSLMEDYRQRVLAMVSKDSLDNTPVDLSDHARTVSPRRAPRTPKSLVAAKKPATPRLKRQK
jgi:DNA-binding FadR family transcriptional regulator